MLSDDDYNCQILNIINIEDIFSIIDVINKNNKKINNNLYFELENHKIIINNFKTSIDSINLNNDINKNIITTK